MITGAQKNRISIRFARSKLFLEDQLDRVGDRLQQAKRPGPVRSDAGLDAGQGTALIPGQVGKACQQGEDHEQ